MRAHGARWWKLKPFFCKVCLVGGAGGNTLGQVAKNAVQWLGQYLRSGGMEANQECVRTLKLGSDYPFTEMKLQEGQGGTWLLSALLLPSREPVPKHSGTCSFC